MKKESLLSFIAEIYLYALSLLVVLSSTAYVTLKISTLAGLSIHASLLSSILAMVSVYVMVEFYRLNPKIRLKSTSRQYSQRVESIA